VYVSAPASRDVLQRWRDDIEIVPNGVDPLVFSGSYSRPADLPTGPIVGYAGKLAERIDAELVAATARSMPGVTFVFLGPILQPSAIAAMRGIPNILLLGDRSYDRLPGYLGHFDIGWIPHRVGAGETGGDPIKLYEYWAAGLPVVSTPIDGWEAWGPGITIVRDAMDAGTVLASILSADHDHRRPQVPPERTWTAIAARLLEPLLPR
jgi:glycosyltransferase involved in cell wall biosynthesis